MESPCAQHYFFGRISRHRAERILAEQGLFDGLYLLRESSTVGNYVLSLSFADNVHHYSIERQPDGTYMIPEGRRFRGPVELIQHYQAELDGFLTHPVAGCVRDRTSPPFWPGVTYDDVETRLLNFVNAQGMQDADLASALGEDRAHYVNLLATTWHEDMPWYHGALDRPETDRRLERKRDGTFLVRAGSDEHFRLSLSHQGCARHYMILVGSGRDGQAIMQIQDGAQFSNLMDLVAHYHCTADGLVCELTEPCRRPAEYGAREMTLPRLPQPVSPARRGFKFPFSRKKSAPVLQVQPDPPMPKAHLQRSQSSRPPRPPPTYLKPNIRRMSDNIGNSEESACSSPESSPTTSVFVPDEEDYLHPTDYDMVPRTDRVFNLHRDDLKLLEGIGAGQFGEVRKGLCKFEGREIAVAVKTLKADALPSEQSELLKEARVMADLNHRHIVRLIGICHASSFLLVMELAGMGPLNKYLIRRRSLPLWKVVTLMLQVAEGMAYLESKSFVHRDLAARNVLLVSDAFAKISDFGMSRALGVGNEYYKAEKAGKLPLKWYAPECIYYLKFDSKSDVWSYGVTLWEAASYGEKPYGALRGEALMARIQARKLLERPSGCPQDVYDIMVRCWRYEREDRPSFTQIYSLLETALARIKPQ